MAQYRLTSRKRQCLWQKTVGRLTGVTLSSKKTCLHVKCVLFLPGFNRNSNVFTHLDGSISIRLVGLTLSHAGGQTDMAQVKTAFL
jgi:hypothetical protein